MIWDSAPDSVNSFYPYTLWADVDKEQLLVIICIGNRIVAEQKKAECIEKGFQTILALDYGYEDSVNRMSSLEFSLNMGCSLNCKYCPQDVLMRAYKEKVSEKIQRHLTLDEFKKILVNELNPCSMISFSGMAEPFENPECIEMLEYADSHGFRIHLNTTLMGLTRQGYERVKDINIEGIWLHVPDEEGLSHFKVTEEYCLLLADFIDYFKDKIQHFSVHSTNIDKRVRHIVQEAGNPIEDASEFSDRAGNLEVLKMHTDKNGPLFCTIAASSYSAHTVLPSGKMVLCCEDYGIVGMEGNIVEQSWDEIIKDSSYGKFRIGIDNDEWICKKCKYALELNETILKYPDFPYEKMNCSYVYNIAQNYLNRIADEYRAFFEKTIYLWGLNNSKESYYFFDSGWREIFKVIGFTGEENLLGVKTVRNISWVDVCNIDDKSIPIMVMGEKEEDVERLRNKGFNNVSLFKDVVLSYL